MKEFTTVLTLVENEKATHGVINEFKSTISNDANLSPAM